MNKAAWIEKINALDPEPKNKFDKGGKHLLECMEYYGVNSLQELSEEQLQKFYELKTNDKWTVSLYQGAGAWLTPYEVTAQSEEEALENAVLACLGEDDENSYLMVDGGKEYKETLEYYEKEFKEYKKRNKDHTESDFLSNYLNMIYLDLSTHGKENVWIKYTYELKIKKGIDIYENSIKENEES